MPATVTPLHRGQQATASGALDALNQHLDRSTLAAHTVLAYRRQAAAFLGWLAANTGTHPDAFADEVGANAAVNAYRRYLLDTRRASPSTTNQALAAVTLLYRQGAAIHLTVKRARVARPGEPDALTRPQHNALQRAADRRGTRDAALIALLLGTGARVAECARLTVADVPLTARTGTARLFGKGDQVRTVPVPSEARERLTKWLTTRSELLTNHPDIDALWIGQRGPLTEEGVTKVVLACGHSAGLTGLRPHRLRHTYATRLRKAGADLAQIQHLLGHASGETTARYIRAGATEVADLVDRALED